MFKRTVFSHHFNAGTLSDAIHSSQKAVSLILAWEFLCV